eukprot:1884136-Alexandrium_andersonii.AAC.1
MRATHQKQFPGSKTASEALPWKLFLLTGSRFSIRGVLPETGAVVGVGRLAAPKWSECLGAPGV